MKLLKGYRIRGFRKSCLQDLESEEERRLEKSKRFFNRSVFKIHTFVMADLDASHYKRLSASVKMENEKKVCVGIPSRHRDSQRAEKSRFKSAADWSKNV